MGNRAPPAAPAPAAPAVPAGSRYSARLVGHEVVDGEGLFTFAVYPPDASEWPGQHVARSFGGFQELDNAMAQKYRGQAPALPPSTFFACTDPAFLDERAAALEAYLEGVLALEPTPRTKALQRFLNVWRPPGPEAGSQSSSGPLVASGRRLPTSVVGLALAFGEAPWVLRECSAVCRAARAATRDAACWPSLRFRASRAERWLEGLFSLLVPTCGQLQALSLDLAFEDPRLAVALPAGVALGQLRRLELRLWDEEAVGVGTEILECVASPRLQRISVEGLRPCQQRDQDRASQELAVEALLQALCGASLAARGCLSGLRLSWAPDLQGSVFVHEGAALALGPILDSAPRLEFVEIGAAASGPGRGIAGRMSPLQPPRAAVPGTQPLLADMAGLAALQHVTFGFLSDDALFCVAELADASLRWRRVSLWGGKRCIEDPDQALSTLLSKLGDELEEFALRVEHEAALRPFLRGVLRNRVGPLPKEWQLHPSLRSLSLNWTAFDDAGVACIAQSCPELHTLLLDRSEYWTDRVMAEVLEHLPGLRHFRVRASTMLSDRSLYTLMEAAHRFTTLEIERSYSMSHYALAQLGERMSRETDGGLDIGPSDSLGLGLMSFSQGSAGASVVRAMAAMSGEPDPFGRQDGDGDAPSRGHGLLRVLGPEEDEDDDGRAAVAPAVRQHSVAVGR